MITSRSDVLLLEPYALKGARTVLWEGENGNVFPPTRLSIAIAEALLSEESWTARNLARRFVECYQRDKRPGYARRFQAFLEEVTDADDFLARIVSTSDKSGAAMRAAPIGLIEDTATVLEYARIQAKVTHDTPDGIGAAQASAMMSHYFAFAHGAKQWLGMYLDKFVPMHTLVWNASHFGKVGPKGWMSVQAAVTAVMRNDRLSTLLRDCIAFTGDVYTVATIALAAASLSKEYTQDLPRVLVDGLENGTYGRDYLISLDRKLPNAVKGRMNALSGS